MAANPVERFSLLKNIKSYIAENFFQDIHNIPLWFVVFYIFGILFYSSLLSEPKIVLLVSCGAIAGVASYFIVKLRIFLLFVFSFFLGMATLSYKANTIKLPVITAPLHNLETIGVIDQIYPLEKGRRLVLRNVKIAEAPEFDQDIKIHVLVRSKNTLSIGDKIQFTSSLYSTQEKFLPFSYNFARHSFFNKVAATGYAMSKISVIGKEKLSLHNYIDRLRYYIFAEIKKNMPDATANVAAALMIGDQTAIDNKTMDDMRRSGLSHILSVSGMHLSLLSIICFVVIRYFFSYFSSFCQKYNTKKFAAYFSLIATLFYLLVSGLNVAAIRAFIMVALITLAVILDREADAKRSVCFAAFIILLCAPESLFAPSFQMSFVAVVALVSSYELYLFIGKGREKQKTLISKIKFYFVATALSSFVAGSATAIFVIYHFNNYSNYSVFANVFVAPVVSIIIMPMVILSFLLMPLNLHFIALFFLDYGIKAMLKIAEFFSALPASSFIFSKPDDYVIVIFFIGFLWLCFWQEKWRMLGCILIFFSFFMTLVTQRKPDIILDNKIG